jgi:uroporphyrinogen decarboxylase
LGYDRHTDHSSVWVHKDVKEMCAKNIKEIGKGGGLLLAPTHMIEPDVPWENVEAFIEAVEEYGYY